jgi:hypothetical protein
LSECNSILATVDTKPVLYLSKTLIIFTPTSTPFFVVQSYLDLDSIFGDIELHQSNTLIYLSEQRFHILSIIADCRFLAIQRPDKKSTAMSESITGFARLGPILKATADFLVVPRFFTNPNNKTQSGETYFPPEKYSAIASGLVKNIPSVYPSRSAASRSSFVNSSQS